MIMQVPYMPYTRIMDRLLVIEDSADLSRIGRGAMKGNIIFFNRFLINHLNVLVSLGLLDGSILLIKY